MWLNSQNKYCSCGSNTNIICREYPIEVAKIIQPIVVSHILRYGVHCTCDITDKETLYMPGTIFHNAITLITNYTGIST